MTLPRRYCLVNSEATGNGRVKNPIHCQPPGLHPVLTAAHKSQRTRTRASTTPKSAPRQAHSTRIDAPDRRAAPLPAILPPLLLYGKRLPPNGIVKYRQRLAFGFQIDGQALVACVHAYLANSPLVQQITFSNSGVLRMTTTKQYDYLNRLTSVASSSNSFAYQYNAAYDGWNCVATLNSSLAILNSFVWGLDLSGSMQGAGGVGGLVSESYHGATVTNFFIAHDGNGNVSALVNVADGTTLANYEYGP